MLTSMPIDNVNQVVPPMAVSFGRFQYPDVRRSATKQQVQPALPMQPTQAGMMGEGTLSFGRVQAMNGELENLILRELHGTAYFLAISELLEKSTTDGSSLIREDGNTGDIQASETTEQRMRRSRVTNFRGQSSWCWLEMLQALQGGSSKVSALHILRENGVRSIPSQICTAFTGSHKAVTFHNARD